MQYFFFSKTFIEILHNTLQSSDWIVTYVYDLIYEDIHYRSQLCKVAQALCQRQKAINQK